MGRLRSDRGVTLIELLVAMTLSTLVFGTTLTAFDALHNDHRMTERHAESLQKARQTVDRLARQLRNLASPTTLTVVSGAQPQAVDVARPNDLVFRVVDDVKPDNSANTANVMRVRYCVTENPANKRKFRIWAYTQRWTTAGTPATPGTTSCGTGPKDGWQTQTLVVNDIVNSSGAVATPMFTYPGATAPDGTTDPLKVTRIRTELVVDNDPDRRPAATRLVNSVILRNQNQYPIAKFDLTVLDPNRNVRLDGSASSDPEGQTLRYCWFLNATKPLPSCTANPRPTSWIGDGVVLQWQAPAGTHSISLRVEDPAGLSNDSDPQTRTF